MTVPEDYTAIDPVFVQGSTITLNGELTEKYIRSRDTSVLGSNEQRMERQTQFVQALLEKVKSTEDGGEVQAGEEHDEFHVDDASLQEMIINIFYKEVES